MKLSEQLQVAGCRSGYELLRYGMTLCVGCEDEPVPVNEMYCPGCARINEELEARRRQVLLSGLPGRVDAGVVPYPPPPEQLISKGQFVVLLAGWMTTAALCGWAAWWAMRGMVALGLRLSQ